MFCMLPLLKKTCANHPPPLGTEGGFFLHVTLSFLPLRSQAKRSLRGGGGGGLQPN